MGDKGVGWSASDHCRFGSAMFLLGFVFGLCIFYATGLPQPLWKAALAGLGVWLIPLVFTGWLRICTSLVQRVMFPIWRFFRLIP
jgi:hypothetical protein